MLDNRCVLVTGGIGSLGKTLNGMYELLEKNNLLLTENALQERELLR